MKRCPICNKVLFRKKNGILACPNECNENAKRRAFNTVIDPMKDRRHTGTLGPWDNVRY